MNEYHRLAADTLLGQRCVHAVLRGRVLCMHCVGGYTVSLYPCIPVLLDTLAGEVIIASNSTIDR